MKKILFVFGMYKPRMSPNGICCEQVMKKCIEEGNEVWCVVNQERTSPKSENIDGVHVHRIKTRLTYRINEFCEYNPNLKKTKILLKVSKILNKLKLLITIPFWPMISPLYTYRFYKEAKKINKKEKFDIVVGVYTPLDSLYCAHLLKKKYKNIKFVAYFLDALSGGLGPKCLSDKYILKNGKKWEKRLLSNADKIIAMNSSKDHHIKYNKEEEYFNRITFLDIPLLVEKKNVKRSNILESDGINIVFIGLLKYPMRNPRPIIELIFKIKTYFNHDIHLYFIGENNCRNILNEASVNLKDNLHVYNKVNHEEAVSIIMQADFLLNLGTENSSQIPSKLIEYISVGKPIINTFRTDNEPGNKYLKRYPIAFLLDERKEITQDIERDFTKFIKENYNKSIKFEDVKKQYYKNTPDTFVAEIQNL